jgi:hypothetical protein
MTLTTGQRVRVIDAANLPCAPGDSGTVSGVRPAARDYPVGVKLDGSTGIEWFRECELQLTEEQNDG